jgi:hypothetical protein
MWRSQTRLWLHLLDTIAHLHQMIVKRPPSQAGMMSILFARGHHGEYMRMSMLQNVVNCACSQSFSGANRFKKDNDPRTTMIIAVLAAVDHYRPNYFLVVSTYCTLVNSFEPPYSIQ